MLCHYFSIKVPHTPPSQTLSELYPGIKSMTIHHMKIETALKIRLDSSQLTNPLLHLVRIIPIDNSHAGRQDPLIFRIEGSERLERR